MPVLPMKSHDLLAQPAPLYNPRQMGVYLDSIMAREGLSSRSEARRWLIEETDRLKRLRITKGRAASNVRELNSDPHAGKKYAGATHVTVDNPYRQTQGMSVDEIEAYISRVFSSQPSGAYYKGPNRTSRNRLMLHILISNNWNKVEALDELISRNLVELNSHTSVGGIRSCLCTLYTRYKPIFDTYDMLPDAVLPGTVPPREGMK